MSRERIGLTVTPEVAAMLDEVAASGGSRSAYVVAAIRERWARWMAAVAVVVDETTICGEDILAIRTALAHEGAVLSQQMPWALRSARRPDGVDDEDWATLELVTTDAVVADAVWTIVLELRAGNARPLEVLEARRRVERCDG